MTRRGGVMRLTRISLLLSLWAGLALPPAAEAQWAVSSNDNKVVLGGPAGIRTAPR